MTGLTSDGHDEAASIGIDDAGMAFGVVVREIEVHLQSEGVIDGEGYRLVGLRCPVGAGHDVLPDRSDNGEAKGGKKQ